MSENLRKLREEYIKKERIELTKVPPTHRQARVLSEFDRRIKEREEKKKYTLPHWHARYEPLSGMSNIEELERKAREKSDEEQQLKRKVKEVEIEQKSILKELINTLDALRGDEARDSSKYFNLSKKYSDIPTASALFKELSEAEDSHQKKMLLLANELDRKRNQLG